MTVINWLKRLMPKKALTHQAYQKSQFIPVPKNVLSIIRRLQNNGFEAYVVGGFVRDALLGLSPKDVDLATSARPEQIRKLFSNCRLIGKRFRLAHIYFGKEIIEVATFRAQKDGREEYSKEGIIRRDNCYGTIKEDAFRRDFGVNALFYDPIKKVIIDYCGGLKDIEAKKMRLIGKAKLRYHEDPMRILRAIRLCCKLPDFEIETQTHQAIKSKAALLDHIPNARRYDEYKKMFCNGHSEKNYHKLKEEKLLRYLFPPLASYALQAQDKQFYHAAFVNSDQRHKDQKSINPIFLISVLLWPVFMDACTQKQQQHPKHSFLGMSHEVIDSIFAHQLEALAIPRFGLEHIRQIWTLQYKLEQRRPKTIFGLLNHPRIRSAYDFLLLRAANETKLKETAQWWQDFMESDIELQQTMVNKLRKKRVPRGKRKHSSTKG